MVLRAPRFKASPGNFGQSIQEILKSLSLLYLVNDRATQLLEQGQNAEVLTWWLPSTKFFCGKLACDIRRHLDRGESTSRYAQKSIRHPLRPSTTSIHIRGCPPPPRLAWEAASTCVFKT